MRNFNLRKVKTEAEKEIKKAQNLKELDGVFKKYLGKKGIVPKIFKYLENLTKAKKQKIGKETNQIKKELGSLIKEKAKKLEVLMSKKEEAKVDITIPGKQPVIGHLHPLTLVIRKAREIFQEMGFSVIEGSEIENEWYNFDALNIPEDHPARDAWDTFWLKSPGIQNLLLRTHTSPVQVRYMGKNQPPLRVIVPGRVFRYEATDASHEINFYQLEGLMVGKDISVANFKAIIQEFFRRFFGKSVGIRLRPSYFPFTEPSFEVDISCLACQGQGCSACSQTGWLEMMGAGMVHPNVLISAGLIPKNWQGFAFGMGVDRLAMMRYKINDIRLFYSGDLRFFQQF